MSEFFHSEFLGRRYTTEFLETVGRFFVAQFSEKITEKIKHLVTSQDRQLLSALNEYGKISMVIFHENDFKQIYRIGEY